MESSVNLGIFKSLYMELCARDCWGDRQFFLDLTTARAEIHENSLRFTRVLGFDGGEGLNSRDAPVCYEFFFGFDDGEG